MKGRNTLFLIQKSLSLAVFCLSCLCWSPWQQRLSKSILLLPAPAQIQPGSKSAPAFRKAIKRAIFLLFLSTAILFSIFFSFWCIWAGANLSLFLQKTAERNLFYFQASFQTAQLAILHASWDDCERDMPRETQARDIRLQPSCRTRVPCDVLWKGCPSSTHTGFMNKSMGCTAEPLVSASLFFVVLISKYLIWKHRKLNWHCPNWHHKFIILYSPFAFLLLKIFQSSGQGAKALLENLFQGRVSHAAGSHKLHWAKSPSLLGQYLKGMH